MSVVTRHLSTVINTNSHSNKPSPLPLYTVGWFTKTKKSKIFSALFFKKFLTKQQQHIFFSKCIAVCMPNLTRQPTQTLPSSTMHSRLVVQRPHDPKYLVGVNQLNYQNSKKCRDVCQYYNTLFDRKTPVHREEGFPN